MADDKSKVDKRDRQRVAGGADYEVEYLARETGITTEQARELVKAYGSDRQTLVKAASALSSSAKRVKAKGVKARRWSFKGVPKRS